jgi:hypothetical protein
LETVVDGSNTLNVYDRYRMVRPEVPTAVFLSIQVKVKLTPQQTTKARRGRSIALLFL